MISLLLFTAAATVQPRPDCKNAMTQADMNICSGLDASAADAAMTRAYDRAAVLMRRMDRGLDRKSDKRIGYFQALLASQRSWLKYRDAECLIERFSARGGSMEPLLANVCYEQLTKDRTKTLRTLLDSYSH